MRVELELVNGTDQETIRSIGDCLGKIASPEIIASGAFEEQCWKDLMLPLGYIMLVMRRLSAPTESTPQVATQVVSSASLPSW